MRDVHLSHAARAERRANLVAADPGSKDQHYVWTCDMRMAADYMSEVLSCALELPLRQS